MRLLLREQSFSIYRLNYESPGIVFNDHELANVFLLVDGPQLVKSRQHIFQELMLLSKRFLVKILTFEVPLVKI